MPRTISEWLLKTLPDRPLMTAIWVLRGSDKDGAVTFRIPHGTSKTVGRAARADFIVKAALVSRLHCRIVGGDQRMEVEESVEHERDVRE